MPTSTHRRFFHFCSFRDFFFIDRKNPYSRSVPSDAAGEALEAALKTNTALATLQIHSGLSAAAVVEGQHIKRDEIAFSEHCRCRKIAIAILEYVGDCSVFCF